MVEAMPNYIFFLVYILQALSFRTSATSLSSSLLVVIQEFNKENVNSKTCAFWSVTFWMRNWNVDELLESCGYHLSNVRLEEVKNSSKLFPNFPVNFMRKFLSLVFSNFST